MAIRIPAIANRMTTINRVCNLNQPQFNIWNIEFNKCPVFIAHYIHQSEETYINRKINLPTDDTNSFRQKDDNIHDKHNETDNMGPKRKYAKQVFELMTANL